jgi:hypothetical protein
MSSLRELQAAIAESIRAGDTSAAQGLVVSDAIAATARLAIYRNHFLVTLKDVVAATFPVVERLVGRPFFNAAAHRFVQSRPPTSPCLFEYGGAFADFLDGLPEVAGLPYLADVARLEWALAKADNAADVEPLTADGLVSVPPEYLTHLAFTLHPSASLVVSAFPIDRIWRANQDCNDSETVDLSSGGAHLLIHRSNGEVGWCALSAPEFAFVAALDRGVRLDHAVASASAAGDVFDLAALLAVLLDGAVLSSFSLISPQEFVS